MDNNEFEPDKGPTRPIPAGSDIPTKPGERLRRILAASEENTQPFKPTLGGSQPAANINKGDQPVSPLAAEPQADAEADQPSELQSTPDLIVDESAPSSEPQAAAEPIEVEAIGIAPEITSAEIQPEESPVTENGSPAVPAEFAVFEPPEGADLPAASVEAEPVVPVDVEPVDIVEAETASLLEEKPVEAPALAEMNPPTAEQAPITVEQIEDAQPGAILAGQEPEAEPKPEEPPESGPSGALESAPLPDRHPTGEPEQTGGWYSDSVWLPEPTKAEKSEEPTQPMVIPPASPAPASSNTIPVPVRPQRTPNLPQRVDEVDVNATRVTSAAYGQPIQPRRGNLPYRAAVPPAAPPPVRNYAQGQKGRPAGQPLKSKPRKKGMGCFWKGLIGVLFIGVLGIVGVLSFLIYQYFTISAQLPSVDNLQARAFQFETTRIVDRNGNTIYEILNPNAGRRTYVTLDKISPYLIAATMATEDKDFYTHPGFDIVALFRALWQNYSAGTTVSGASTITQQLAKMLLLSPTEAVQQTVQRKAREIILAAELTRQYSKDEILEIYLNEINYGNRSYGIEAAAESYFNTTAEKLTLGQSAFLAGIPQAPSVYDIFSNRTQTIDRFHTVIMLMYTLSQERDCIDVSNSVQKVCVDAVAVSNALDEIEKNTTFAMPASTIKDPHWVTYIRTLLEAQFDPQTIYRSGFTVYTTLDQNLQDKAQQVVTDQIKSLVDKHVTDGALVAIRPSTGEILAMVGSADFYNDQIAGQINMAISPRQPGSSIKPITYTAAFEKGWTPSTVIWDVPSEFPPSGDPNDTRPPYKPTDYSGHFQGPVTVRYALANSLNVPAVKALQFVGIYDNPATPGQDGLISLAKRMGITTLTNLDYGLSLTLGGGEVTVLDMTSAFSVFANSGMRNPPFAISKIVDHDGKTVYEYQPPAPVQVIRPEHAFLITSILSDNAARAPSFGTNSVLNLPFPSAVKTGTTNDFKDNWTIGYSPDLAVGVWVGNADDTPMVGTTGITGAGPIWSDFMKAAVPVLSNNKPQSFTRPAGIVEKAVCAISGTEPSQWCPNQRGEFFASDQPPLPKEQDFWQNVSIDTWTGLRASSACSEFTQDKMAMNVTDPWAIKWLTTDDNGKGWAKNNGFSDPIFFTPSKDCTQNDSRPSIVFSSFRDGDTITTTPLDIYAVVDATSGFKQFKLEYGIGDKPVTWKQLGDVITQPAKQPTKIYSWDMQGVPPGKFSLRITLSSDHNTSAVKTIVLNSQVPTATPTSTMTATPTSTPTSTPTLTPTPTATPVPSNTPTPTNTLVPTTPVPSATPTQTLPPPPPPA